MDMHKKQNDLNGIIDALIHDPQARAEVCRNSHYLFFHVYFGHYVGYATAPFQKELFGITESDKVRMAVVEAFRGSGKTTIMNLSYPIWAILGKQRKKFVVLLAHTQEQARQYLKNIKQELEQNALLRADLGPFEEPNDEWRGTSIVLPKYGARITVVSSEQKMRGLRHHQYRPDLILADDLEDLQSVKTKEGRDKLYEWLMGDVIPAGDLHTKIIVIGTRLHNDSLIMRLRQNIDDGKLAGIHRRYPLMNDERIPVWPAKFPTPAEIESLHQTVPNEQAWQREYLLKIIPDDDQLVHEDWIAYYDELPSEERGDYRYAIVGIDLAISQSDTADYTAMVAAKVFGSGDNLRVYILPHPVNERLDFPQTVDRVRALSKAIGRPKLIIENVGYQQALIDQLKTYNLFAIGFSPHGGDKRAKLTMATPMVQNGKILFPKKGVEELLVQLIGFGVEKHDDLTDAFAMMILEIMDDDNTSSRLIIGPYTPPGSQPPSRAEGELKADIELIRADNTSRQNRSRMLRR